MKTFEYVVVGSGCAGAIAARTLVEAGANVTMLDVGNHDSAYESKVPEKNFLDIRRQEPDQYRYILGESGEGLSTGAVSKGAQVTPTRRHMLADVDKYIPLTSDSFSPLESLGYGGLGAGWGLQCWEFSDADLRAAGLSTSRMPKAYETVAGYIGISGTRDEAGSYTLGRLKNFQPSPAMDRNNQLIYEKYQARSTDFLHRGVYVGRTPLALITEAKDNRKAYGYTDMDFYADHGRSAWRPWITIEALKQRPNFSYLDSLLVTAFKENSDGLVTINCLNTKTGKAVSFGCRKLILGSSALGTARIVLRSLGNERTRLPLLSNPHSYIPCLQPRFFGQGPQADRLGFGQLSMFIDPSGRDKGVSVVTTYSYQSLMLFRLINQVPLNLADARVLLRYLSSGLIIMIAQHPDAPSKDKYLRLKPLADSLTGDILEAGYELTREDRKSWDKREKSYIKAMRRLGTYAFKRLDPGHGSSIHYAGTLPFSKQVKDFALAPSGHLHGTRNVYVADSAGFNYLPAKGLTFSLMANAHLTAENVLRND